jgi:hypothetical protein
MQRNAQEIELQYIKKGGLPVSTGNRVVAP